MARIRFDRVHRMGKKGRGGGDQRRPIVAKFNPSEGRHIVFSHVKNLDKSKGFGVNEQLPRELAERKKSLMPQYKQARQNNQQTKWSLDKLLVDGKVNKVEQDKISDINLDTSSKAMSLQLNIAESYIESTSYTRVFSISWPMSFIIELGLLIHVSYIWLYRNN